VNQLFGHCWILNISQPYRPSWPVAGIHFLLLVFFTTVPVLCETWSLTVREEHKLRVFENRVLRKIFGPKRGGVMGGWRKLHNEELHNLYSSPSIIRIIKSRRMRWAGHVAQMGEKRNVYRLLVGKLEGKRPLGRPRRRWMDNIKMNLLEIGVSVVDWIGLAHLYTSYRVWGT
jgi:hypothetical protein